MTSIDVIYARHLKAGDLYAGRVNLDAPTRPVQPFAAAHRVTSVTPCTRDGRTLLHIGAGPFSLDPLPVSALCLVIRPGASRD